MRDVIIAFRNSPSILFWEAGNNSINKEHMAEMRAIKEKLDPSGGRFMGCRTLNTEDVIEESEFVGTMLNRHAARFTAEHGPIMELNICVKKHREEFGTIFHRLILIIRQSGAERAAVSRSVLIFTI